MRRIGFLEQLNTCDKDLILALAAHCDDVPIALGGTLCKMLREDYRIRREEWVFTGGDNPTRRLEEENAAREFGLSQATILDYPDGELPAHEADILAHLKELRDKHNDQIALIFAPNRSDRHQDHRTVSRCAYRAFRDHLILEYEITSYDGELIHPNVYVAIEEELIRKKTELLMQCYPSRACHLWWDPEVFHSLARVRGVQSNTRYAEAFVARKLVN
jgi:LmbE family N-acetylglucosaminyl deacetylase